MNNKVNPVSSVLNLAVSICETILSVHCKSVAMLRDSIKIINTMRIANNSEF